MENLIAAKSVTMEISQTQIAAQIIVKLLVAVTDLLAPVKVVMMAIRYSMIAARTLVRMLLAEIRS
jgi:hypothetical protein